MEGMRAAIAALGVLGYGALAAAPGVSRPGSPTCSRTASARWAAAHLHLSESSVEKHVNAIFTKLGLTTEDLSHRRVTAMLTFLRDAGLRG